MEQTRNLVLKCLDDYEDDDRLIKELNQIDHPFKELFITKYQTVLQPYLAELNGYVDKNILNTEQVKNFIKINWSKDKIQRFYEDRGFAPERIDSVIGKMFQ